MMGRVCRDRALREAVLARQRRRLAAFKARKLETELREALAPVFSCLAVQKNEIQGQAYVFRGIVRKRTAHGPIRPAT